MNHNAEILEKARAAGRNKDYQKALQMCLAFIEANPESADGFRARSDVYGLMGDFANAINDRNAALQRDRANPADFFFRGWWNLEINELQAAVEDLNNALRIGNELNDHHLDEITSFFRALAYLRMGRYDEALADVASVRDDFLMYIKSGQVSKAKIVTEAKSKKTVL